MRGFRIATALAVALIGASLVGCGGSDDEFGVGSDAPAFELPSSSGGTTSLADFGDEPVLLYFHMAEG